MSTSDNLREYDPSSNESRPSTAFIDLAIFGELEKRFYDTKSGTRSYFVRETVRSTWFTQIPIKMNLDTANPNFNQTFNAEVARTGDYLLNAWLRVTLNAVSIYNPSDGFVDANGSGSETITWSPNFMHHLVEHCSLKVSGMTIDELYSEHLDFLTAFTVPKGSRAGYNRMIGNFCSPNNGMAGINVCGVKARTSPNLNAVQELFLPLPFFFSKDTGLALPMAALPYANVKIQFKLRDWSKLLASIDSNGNYKNATLSQLKNQTPKLSNVQVWGNYALVSKEERRKMGCTTRDMIIEQNQQLGGSHGSKMLNGESLRATTSIDLRLGGSIKALFFGGKNLQNTVDNPYRGSYSVGPSASDVWGVKLSISGTNINAKVRNSLGGGKPPPTNIHLNWFNGEINDNSSLTWDRDVTPIIGTAAIFYENTPKIQMEGLYYSLIQPYNHAKNTPQSDSNRSVIVLRDPNEVGGISTLAAGYHMYSYSLNIGKVDPLGSTNYGKLSNASLLLTPGRSTVNSIKSGKGPFRIFISAINHNVMRVKGGTLGFPIL